MRVAEQTIGSSGRTGEDRAQRAPEYPRTLEYPADTDDEVAVQKRFLEGLRAEMAEGPRPRQLLVTLMADYWITPGASAPSGALVDLLEEFDVPPSGTRTLLSRLCRQGRLESFKEGRRTFYSIAPGSRRRLVSGFSAIARFGAEKEPDPFIWTCLMFSVPEGMRTRRLRLHKGLRWMGFAPLYDGVWVSPQAAREQVDALLKSQEISSATVFEATAYSAGLTYGQPTDAWSIPTLQDQYARFLDEAGQALQRVSEGKVTAAEALVMRTELINVWRCFPRADPSLPLGLLPQPWPRQEAAELFSTLYAQLEPLASSMVHNAVERHSRAHMTFVSSHRVADAGAMAKQFANEHLYFTY
ncbi:PaaX family transcriptional regulator C-terminal domain-containing protein [Nesterenkonia sp. NBAIMH1]|uniref:PaaX family transcriptional regulator n=1 Tax=Nesterenkonia sp. NBAIMH1 TaxID=2600320 RepID=UPI0011B406B2|nr:PaaX family transcriptional regulator C-terminal domain-containing protein [Nesterenkonia sp. NBAIMH1]